MTRAVAGGFFCQLRLSKFSLPILDYLKSFTQARFTCLGVPHFPGFVLVHRTTLCPVPCEAARETSGLHTWAIFSPESPLLPDVWGFGLVLGLYIFVCM